MNMKNILLTVAVSLVATYAVTHYVPGGRSILIGN